MAVVAQVRRDENELGRALARGKIRRQLLEADDVLGAGGPVDQRVEIHERVVAGRVLIALGHRRRRRLGALGRIIRTQLWIAAGRGLALPIVAHVLQVAAPAFVDGGELVRQRVDRRRVDAAAAYGLAVRGGARGDEVGEDLAVVARLGRASLAADHRQVVAEAVMGGAEVLRQQHAPLGQRAREIRRARMRPEGIREALVLEHDHEDVSDGGPGGRRRRGSCRRQTGSCRPDCECQHGDPPKCSYRCHRLLPLQDA